MCRSLKLLFACLFFCFIPLALHASGVSYSVEFEGLNDDRALKAIKSVSQLTSLKKRPPASINALRYRAESDVPQLIKVLHAHGYYEAKVNIRVQEILNQVHVIVVFDPGPVYRLEEYQILMYCESPDQPEACCPISLDDIAVKLGKPALTETILSSELAILQLLSERGFPLAQIEGREIIVDGKTKGVRVLVAVKTGQMASFGPTTIVGTDKVKPLFVEQKMEWTEGEEYDSCLIENTQTALLDSGLFSSVLITHEDSLGPNGELPLKIEVSETKHKSINVGVSYQTVFGPGITFGWENRNVGGMGRRLSFQGDITRISHSGIGLYLHPDFLRIGQDYIWQAQAMHESLFAYSMRSYNIMNRIDRKIGKYVRLSGGVHGERLYVTASEQNGNYWLLEFPMYVRYSTANHLLNPTRGLTLEYTATPSINTTNAKDCYFTNRFSESTYHPLNHSESVVIAQQLTLGSILSETLESSPLSKRFLGGSEEDLRGYRYRTVSPLVDGKPIGGRSAIYFTLETRFRVSKTIGLVPFLDLGSVYKTVFPTWHGKWYKSTGLGLRYFSFMGPFRFDLAFPLNRRKGIDPVYRVLVSIGQTF